MAKPTVSSEPESDTITTALSWGAVAFALVAAGLMYLAWSA
jgi:hypothetical protein